MKRLLEKKVRVRLAQDAGICKGRWDEAEAALRRGDTSAYLGARADATRTMGEYYWLLGDRDTARYWYRLYAEVTLESHRWFPVHEPTYPINVDLTGDALAMVEAGLIEEAREYLVRARQREFSRPKGPNQNNLLFIGLGAAQIGFAELVPLVQYYVDAQQRMFRAAREPKRQTVALFLRHPWVEAQFLLGDYRACREELARVFEAEARVERQKVRIYGSRLESRVSFEVAHGLAAIIAMVEGEGDRQDKFHEADSRLWKALHISYQIDQTLYPTYLVRLYLYMAQDVLEGRTPNPCPLAGT